MYSISSFTRFQFVLVLVAFLFFLGCASEDLAKKSSDGSSSASSMKSKMRSSEGGSSMPENEREARRSDFKKRLASLEDSPIYFDFDKSDIRPDMRTILDKNARFMMSYPSVLIQIEGHCDERGTVEYNIALGHRRSQATKDYLISLGVDASRIDTVSYGEERPADSGHDESAWSKNRRAKFNVIGGIPAGLN
tara:strand:- start:82 stop:660 length:579 start_codon:yes stop_codon:yes gene_type:complete